MAKTTTHTTIIDGRTITYKVRPSRRARRIRLVMDLYKGLEFVIPEGLVLEDHEAIIHSRADWILPQLDEMEQLGAVPRYATGETFPYLGQDLTLRVEPGANKSRSTVKHDSTNATLIVKLAQELTSTEYRDAVQTALASWYRREARTYITARVTVLAQQHGFQYNRVAIRAQKTRWGSCSTLGNLNFNYRLIMAPPDAIDYLILHELAHLRHMDHSPRFWKLLESMCPTYRTWRDWFRHNKHLLRI